MAALFAVGITKMMGIIWLLLGRWAYFSHIPWNGILLYYIMFYTLCLNKAQLMAGE